uniref:Renin receptor-like C-terminal transmembrane spanning segment domain-containing protein n=1 Tax=Panagrolaimus superbus TaxID=310955 RepID=A0A914Z391_9BILA
MLAAGRSLLQRCSLFRNSAVTSKYSTTSVENVPKLNELAEDEPVIPEDVEAGVADTEEVVMIRQKYPYSQKVLKELKLDQYPYYVEREWWKKGHRMTFWAEWRMLRDVRRRESLAEHGAERQRLKAMHRNNILPQAIRDEAADRMLNGLPRHSYPSLILNMCQFTGRRRGKIKPYRVNRHIFRKLADHGQLSGVQRAIILETMAHLKLLVLLAVLGVVASEKNSEFKTLENFRINFGVYSFVSSDYPAMFTLVAGIVIVLAAAIIFISVGLLTMDPGKDSIIYRMTTTRMKKD